ncbi:MAG TPA: dTDP-4-dehydrorhamnose 3,5-epimerase [Oligoflexus sp.]|uniref:dTDP-4-dehydrorhamnose 3,5-epimerase n=1 Tax=Oligoflexus sp. TaxID=1971216 RepID=UPI002D32C715|nr:dTDP-4-dehydrorhamnose 3,5-epimerase [Oligoflexus sp.]HYX38938.1 dTDP-4-dehydrorhamnose 3,5-epimerase [Oligoflexus sp.]
MDVRDVDIPGLKVIQPKIFGDERGFFLETYNSQRYHQAGLPATFVQDNVSFSCRGTLRGLHFQNPCTQGKLVMVLQGEVYDVAVDVRLGSPTFGKSFAIYLSSKTKQQFWVPAGFAHGFMVTSDAALFVYKCDALYSPQNEFSLAWDDPDLGIDWPDLKPILSAKDSNARRLRDFPESQLPVY